MDLLYCNKKIPGLTLKSFLHNYFKLESPETFYDKDCINLQCRARRRRSISDLLMIAKVKFPDIILEDVLTVLAKLAEKNIIRCIYCTTIHKFVITSTYQELFDDIALFQKFPNDFFTGYTYTHQKYREPVDGIDYKKIANFLTEYNENKRKSRAVTNKS